MNRHFNDLPVRVKIIGNSVVLLLLLLLIAMYACYSMISIGKELKTIVSQDLPLTENITAITEHQLQQTIHFERAMRHGMTLDQATKAKAYLQKEMVIFDDIGRLVDEGIKQAALFAGESGAHAHNEEVEKEFAYVSSALQKIAKEHADFEQHGHQVFALLKAGKRDEAEIMAEKMEHEADLLDKEIVGLLKRLANLAYAAGVRAEELEGIEIKLLVLVSIFAVLLGGYLSWAVSANINRRLRVATESLDRIASGHLAYAVSVDGADELGQLQHSMLMMQGRLLAMIQKIGSTAVELSTASDEVSKVMAGTVDNIQSQQSETAEMSIAMNEMGKAVADVNKRVDASVEAANAASVDTAKGQQIVQATISGVQQLANKIDSAAEVISQVEQSSNDINAVLEVIKSIAEQTNLLALNAAIEAARAGEQGRGFAVVADEVRTLASRTQESTAEINVIIERLQFGASSATQAMTESREKSESVVGQAGLAGSSLSAIAGSVTKIEDMSTQIAADTDEQSAAVENMNGNVLKINEMVMAGVSGTQQTAAAGKDLARISFELQGLIAEFKTE